MLKGIKLLPYQQRVIDDLQSFSSIGLFMGTGTGKTYTSLYKARQVGKPNLLVICPQKIVTQWFSEIEKVTDYRVATYKMNNTVAKKSSIINEFVKSNSNVAIVVNIESLAKFNLDFIDDTYTIILDESHKIKNGYKLDRKGQVKSGYNAKSALDLSNKTDSKIILTATPTEKKLGGYIDYYSQLKFLGYLDMSEVLFKNRYCFEQKVQRPGMPFPIKEIIGYRMQLIDKEIMSIVKNVCRSYIPTFEEAEPLHIKVGIEKSKSYNKFIEQRAYKEITCDNVSAYRVAKRTLVSGDIMGTDEYGERYIYEDNTNKADWLEEFLSNTDEVIAVLYNFNSERDRIIKVCKSLGKKYKVIDGHVKDKPAAIKEEFDVLIGQYKAVGESLDGLHLKCHIMVLYSMPDSSEVYTQSCGRIDRVGQKLAPVYYHLLMIGTIDDIIQARIDSKKEFSDRDILELEIKEFEYGKREFRKN